MNLCECGYVCMCVQVCYFVCICMYVYVHICMSVYVRIHVRMYAYVSKYSCPLVCLNVCVRVRVIEAGKIIEEENRGREKMERKEA